MTAPAPFEPEIEILRTGSFTGVGGASVSFSAADLDRLAQSYSAKAAPAPVVIGHPELDAPAHGWVKSLERRGDRLIAKLEALSAPLVEAVRGKAYRKVSVALYGANRRSNPVPGERYLRHVGFLGAHQPAVPGLAPVQFADGDEAELVIELADELQPGAAPPEINTATPGDPSVATKEQGMTDDLNTRVAALDAREAELKAQSDALAKQQRDFADAQRQHIHAGNVAFADGLVQKGAVTPGAKDDLVLFMDAIAAHDAIAFSDADKKLAPLDYFRTLLDGAKPVINLGGKMSDDNTADVAFADDADGIAAAAQKLIAEASRDGRTLTIDQAVMQVTRKKA
jgi:hypothetical protein